MPRFMLVLLVAIMALSAAPVRSGAAPAPLGAATAPGAFPAWSLDPPGADAPAPKSTTTVALQSFSADVKVAAIPETMEFALPGSLRVENGVVVSWYPAFWMSLQQCHGNDCTIIQIFEDCRVTDCQSGEAVTMAPEQGLRCDVRARTGAATHWWPCTLTINEARDTFHVTGTSMPALTNDPFYTFTQYVADPVVVRQGLSCYPRRGDQATATPAAGSNAVVLSDAAGDVAGMPCDAGGPTTIDAALDAATDIVQVNMQVAAQVPSPVSLDQYGLTGTWINTATPGEGFVFENYPSIDTLALGWFTYDKVSGGADRQRWYVLSGGTGANASLAELSVGVAYGGNFDAPPSLAVRPVGAATLTLDSCTHGTLDFYFYSDGSAGRIDVQRLTPNLDCTASGTGATSPPQHLLSGNWFDSSLNGQGIQFEFNQAQQLLFAPWYTYALNGSQFGAVPSSQRWYTLQLAGVDPAATSFHDIAIHSTTGGVFDSSHPTVTTRVGSADLVFQTCGSATLTYAFDAGENTGRTGSIDLVRVGPVPAGCTL